MAAPTKANAARRNTLLFSSPPKTSAKALAIDARTGALLSVKASTSAAATPTTAKATLE